MKIPSSNLNEVGLLDRAVLVLNANYSPMMICTAKRAICLDYLDKIDILANYNEKVSSPSLTLDLPSVIKIKNYVRYDNLSLDLNRKNIISRDDYLCQYCGCNKGPLTIDHIIPKGKGGTDTWENLVAACKPCNQKKGNQKPEEVGMSLRKKPKRPNRLHYFQKFVKEKQKDWRPYLFMEPFKT
tara:strand:- start:28 stop:579 length:552 start_codon:yes stop_codon:yes gene_type:complete